MEAIAAAAAAANSLQLVSDSVQPHRWQPTRLHHPWNSPGKNTGVGYHFLLQCLKVKSESEVAQSCPTLSDPMDYSLPGSSVHGILCYTPLLLHFLEEYVFKVNKVGKHSKVANFAVKKNLCP